jgi:large subunit ribosomal protein L9
MNVILLQDVENLGAEGDVVTVKNGFARNYLIPRSLARQATPGVLRAVEEEKRQQSRKIAAQADQARTVAQQLDGLTLTVPARAGDDGRLFGSITTTQLADLLAQQGFNLDRRRIVLDEDVRATGVYSGAVKLHPEVTGRFKFEVVPDTAG